MDVSSRPSLGVRAIGLVAGTQFGGSLGVEGDPARPYGALLGRLEVDQFPGTPMRCEVEHRWDRYGERRFWRLTLRAARRGPYWATFERQYSTEVLWAFGVQPPTAYGQRVVARPFRESMYLTRVGRRTIARVGLMRGLGIGATLSATF